MKKSILSSLVILALNSCSFGPPDDLYYKQDVLPVLQKVKIGYVPQTYDGVLEPKTFSVLESGDDPLEGIDSNQNGIRDEIEIYINRTFKHDYERIVAKDYARWAFYYLKNFKKMTPSELKEQQIKSDRLLYCSSYLESWGHEMSKEFRGFGIGHLFDSFDRVVAFNTMFQDSHKGEIHNLTPGVDVVVKYCPKEITDKYPIENLKQKSNP